jgi:hypothetical protein
MHHDSPMSPQSAFGTPALSSIGSPGLSLSSSHDTLSSLATPATGFSANSPAVYLSPASPQPLQMPGGGGGGAGGQQQFFGMNVGAEGSGLGLHQPLDEPKSKPKTQQQQSRSHTHRRAGSTTRPPEVSRKGEDLGLTLGDFDMLDTLGCVPPPLLYSATTLD